jgi:hypothetical protein
MRSSAFSNYRLDWGSGSNPTTWSTAGITLANSGTQPVSSGLLGRWDTRGLTVDQAYTLRLTVRAGNGVAAQTVAGLTVDADLVPGWPKAVDVTSLLNVLPAPVPLAIDPRR